MKILKEYNSFIKNDFLDLESVIDYLDGDINKTTPWGQNALQKCILAVKSPTDEQLCIDIIDYLVDNGIDINHVDNTEETPLTLAYKNSRWTILDYLIEKGADMNKNTYDILITASEIDTLDNIIKLLDMGIEWSLGFFENLKPAEQDIIKEKFPEKYKDYMKRQKTKEFNL